MRGIAKFCMFFKDSACKDAINYPDGIDDEIERDSPAAFAAHDAAEPYLDYGECLMVEIDVKQGTARVVPIAEYASTPSITWEPEDAT